MGRSQINDPDESMTARFAKGTLARIRTVLRAKEPLAAFMREAVEREIARRLKLGQALTRKRPIPAEPDASPSPSRRAKTPPDPNSV